MNMSHLLTNCSNCLKKYFDLGINEIGIFYTNLMTNSELLVQSFLSIYFNPILMVTGIYMMLLIFGCTNITNIALLVFQFTMILLKINGKDAFFHSKYFSIFFLFYLIVSKAYMNYNFGLIIELISVIVFHKEITSIFIVASFNLFNSNPVLDETLQILILTVFCFHFKYYFQAVSKIQNKEIKLHSFNIIESNINITLSNQDASSNSYFAGIVHDLRNPVGAVSNTFESLLESSRINNEERTSIQSALFCCKIQLMLINNLLDMSKINANKFELHVEEFNLPMLIYMIIKTEDQYCQRKKLNLKRNILNTLPRVVIGDQNRISQILFNIIGNSIKFTSKGFIRISCAWLKNWDSIDFSEDSMKASLFINRKKNVISLDSNTIKKTTSHKIFNDFPAGDDVFDDSSIQHSISNYYFNTKSLTSKDKFIQSSKKRNSPSDLHIPEPNLNNENKLLLPNSILPIKTPNILSEHKNFEENKTGERQIRDFFNICDINNYSNDGILYIEVVDTGEGIKKEEQSTLFKPFSQANSKVKSLGTGLGLWISMSLIEKMGGTMKMYSEYGRGTVTKIAIPLKIIKFNTLTFLEESQKVKINFVVDPKTSPVVQRHAETTSRSFQVYIFAENVDMLKKLFPLESMFKENYSQAFFFFIEYSGLKKMNLNYSNIIKRNIFFFIISEEPEDAIEEITNIQNLDLNLQIPMAKEIYTLVKSNDEKTQELLAMQGVKGKLYKEITIEMVYDYLNAIISAKNNDLLLNSGFSKRANNSNSFQFDIKQSLERQIDSNRMLLKENIMIVDDDIFSSNALSTIIKNLQNIQVLEANSGTNAFNLYKEHYKELFLIFIDKSMVPLDGIDTCKLLRKYETEEKIEPVIIIGISGDPDNDLFLKAGANEFFQKPVTSIIINQLFIKYKFNERKLRLDLSSIEN